VKAECRNGILAIYLQRDKPRSIAVA